VVFSFNADRFPSLPWKETTVHWYREAFANEDLLRALTLSLKTSLGVTLVTMCTGSLAAWALLHTRTRTALSLAALFALPFLVPPLLLGLALRMASNLTGGVPAAFRILVAHTLVFSPLVFALVYARLVSTGRTLEPVARDLGCGVLGATWRIHLPLAAPVMGGAALLVFALTWDEFTMAWLLLDMDVTFPVRVWGMMEGAVSPEINAVGTLTMACTVPLFALAISLLTRRRGSS
jgi:spermidine/putrescine transport system permease protein